MFSINSDAMSAEVKAIAKRFDALPKHIAKKHLLASMRRAINKAKGVPTLRRLTPPLNTRRGRRAKGENGRVTALECVRLEWTTGEDGRQRMTEIEGSAFDLKADLVFLAMGFVGPRHDGAVVESGVELDARGNVLADTVSYRTTDPRVFACGDVRRGQSLVVWGIREGRQCARAVDEQLMGASRLPR